MATFADPPVLCLDLPNVILRSLVAIEVGEADHARADIVSVVRVRYTPLEEYC